MFQSYQGLWPNNGDPGASLVRPRGGVAPLRHDLALASYLEKQVALREAGTAIGIGRIASMAAVARALAWLRAVSAGSTFRRAAGPTA